MFYNLTGAKRLAIYYHQSYYFCNVGTWNTPGLGMHIPIFVIENISQTLHKSAVTGYVMSAIFNSRII